MSIIYGVDKQGNYSPNNYECFLASLEGSSIYAIDKGTTAIVLRVDFIESASLFRELVINKDGTTSINIVKSLAIKLGKAINQDDVFQPDREYIGELDMDITIYGKDKFKNECRLQDEIFKKSFTYSLEHFKLPKSICPSVIFGGLFHSSKLGFLYPHIHPRELDFIQHFLYFGEPNYVNTVLLMPFIEDRMILYDFMKAFWEGIEMKDGSSKRITKEKYVNVLSNFLFNIFILHAIGYRHNDLQNTNLLTFGCNLDTIDQCKYYIIDFGQSSQLTKRPSSISDSSIIESMQADSSNAMENLRSENSGSPHIFSSNVNENETLLQNYKKYLSETYVSQYFIPELESELLQQTRVLFSIRTISEEIMENSVIKSILSKELELMEHILQDKEQSAIGLPQENPTMSLGLPLFGGIKTKKYFKKRNRKTNRIRKTKRGLKRFAKKTKKQSK